MIIIDFKEIYNKINFIAIYFREKYCNKYLLKTFIVLFMIYLIGISSIIRADFDYIDDIGRISEGYIGWAGFSRYISAFLSIFIHTNVYLMDISPLTQIMSASLVALSGVILIIVFSDKNRFSISDIIAVIPVGLSPYFLECFSYKFDSPYMALSVLASIVPFLFFYYNKFVFVISSIFFLLIMCMTYQASSGIYILVAIFLFVKRWNKKNDFRICINYLVYSMVSYLISLGIFKVFIMKPVVSDGYVSADIIPINQLLYGLLNNIFCYFTLLETDFTKTWLILLGLIYFSFVYAMLCNSKIGKLKSLLLAILVLFVGSIFSFGLYIFLEKPLFYPRAMFGIGIFISILGLFIVNLKRAYLFKLICFLLSWNFFVFAFVYGNALSEQKRYTDFRVQLLYNDLNKLDISCDINKIKKVELDGNIKKSPILKNMEKHNHIITRLVPDTLGGGWTWSEYYFFYYFNFKGIERNFVKASNYQDLKKLNLPIVVDSQYHTIRANDEYILITLKE